MANMSGHEIYLRELVKILREAETAIRNDPTATDEEIIDAKEARKSAECRLLKLLS